LLSNGLPLLQQNFELARLNALQSKNPRWHGLDFFEPGEELALGDSGFGQLLTKQLQSLLRVVQTACSFGSLLLRRPCGAGLLKTLWAVFAAVFADKFMTIDAELLVCRPRLRKQ
jgi:hypothetical protein